MLLRSKPFPLIHNGVLAALFLTFVGNSYGIQTPWGSRINGFAQHTLMWTDNNNFIAETDDTISSDITDVGITLTHEFNRYWKFSAQVNSHKSGKTSDGEPNLDFAFLKWRALDRHKHHLEISAGRVVLRYGLFNELRDIAHSRPSIFTPYSIYYDRFRSIGFSHDGVGVDYHYHHGFNSLRIEGAFTTPRGTRDEIDQIAPNAGYQESRPAGQEGYYGRITYQQPLQAKYALSKIFLRWDYDAKLPTGNPLMPLLEVNGGFNVGSTGFSMQHHFNTFTTTAELFKHHAQYNGLLPTGDLTLDVDALLLQLQTDCGPLHCLLQYEQMVSHKTELTDKSTTYDLGIGIGWKIMTNLTLRTELHHVDGYAWLNEPQNATHKTWHYIASQIAWAY